MQNYFRISVERHRFPLVVCHLCPRWSRIVKWIRCQCKPYTLDNGPGARRPDNLSRPREEETDLERILHKLQRQKDTATSLQHLPKQILMIKLCKILPLEIYSILLEYPMSGIINALWNIYVTYFVSFNDLFLISYRNSFVFNIFTLWISTNIVFISLWKKQHFSAPHTRSTSVWTLQSSSVTTCTHLKAVVYPWAEFEDARLVVEGEVGDVDGTGRAKLSGRRPEYLALVAHHCLALHVASRVVVSAAKGRSTHVRCYIFRNTCMTWLCQLSNVE